MQHSLRLFFQLPLDKLKGGNPAASVLRHASTGSTTTFPVPSKALQQFEATCHIVGALALLAAILTWREIAAATIFFKQSVTGPLLTELP